VTRSAAYDHLVPLLVEHAAMAAGDPARERLREQLVLGFLPVARNIAKRFAGRGEPTEDLEQVATVGLLGALDRYDPDRTSEFLSYAVPTIMGEVRRYFRDHSWTVRTPRGVKDRYVAVGAATVALSQGLGRAPTVAELAEHLGLSRDQVDEAVAAHGSLHPESLDENLGERDDSALTDILGIIDTNLDHVEFRAMVADLMKQLPERERTIIALRFVHEKTQSEIAAVLCISQMHVSRLLTRTLAQLRGHIEHTPTTSNATSGYDEFMAV